MVVVPLVLRTNHTIHHPFRKHNTTTYASTVVKQVSLVFIHIITLFAQHCVERAGWNSLARTDRRQDGLGQLTNFRAVRSVIVCRLDLAPTTFSSRNCLHEHKLFAQAVVGEGHLQKAFKHTSK